MVRWSKRTGWLTMSAALALGCSAAGPSADARDAAPPSGDGPVQPMDDAERRPATDAPPSTSDGAGCCIAPSCSNGVRDRDEDDGLRNGEEVDVDCGAGCPSCADAAACTSGGDCTSGVCNGGSCVRASCTDAVRNGGETDVDCGGNCSACPLGAHCVTGADCASRSCESSACAASCSDGVQNGGESDVDCGGSCAPCTTGLRCSTGAECASGACALGTCAAPSCSDAVQNGGETGVDCGRRCDAGCPAGAACIDDSDCQSTVCAGAGHLKTCRAETCHDQKVNGEETDYDCGGPVCAGCLPFLRCLQGRDCRGGLCDARTKTCLPSCSDGLLDGMETDVDCGGPCEPCRPDRDCNAASDCTTALCSFIGHGLHCRPVATCANGVRDGSETDVDCGGPLCSRCALQARCLEDADCSTRCEAGACL